MRTTDRAEGSGLQGCWMIEIPDDFASSTIDREGEGSRTWLASLPVLVDELLERWSCTPTATAMHGQVGLVVPVLRHGDPGVLKISHPHPGLVHEPHALAWWGGRGAVLLHERDDSNFAMVLEQAEQTSLADLDDVDEAVAAAGRLVRRLAVPAPPRLPRLRDHAEQWWLDEIREGAVELAYPLPQRVVDAALSTVKELGPDQPDTLVHGDLHYANVLRAEREPWLAIDPKGYVGDPAYDAIKLLRGHFDDLLAADDLKTALLRRLDIFSEAAELERERVSRWAQARAVMSAQWGRQNGDPGWLVDITDQIAEALT